jgi:hypothetical protein
LELKLLAILVFKSLERLNSFVTLLFLNLGQQQRNFFEVWALPREQRGEENVVVVNLEGDAGRVADKQLQQQQHACLQK